MSNDLSVWAVFTLPPLVIFALFFWLARRPQRPRGQAPIRLGLLGAGLTAAAIWVFLTQRQSPYGPYFLGWIFVIYIALPVFTGAVIATLIRGRRR